MYGPPPRFRRTSDGRSNSPDAVALHAPEWIFGVDGLAVRAELAQQLRKLLVDERIGRQPRCASEAATYGPQREQGLVRCPRVAALPELKRLKPFEKVACHRFPKRAVGMPL